MSPSPLWKSIPSLDARVAGLEREFANVKGRVNVSLGLLAGVLAAQFLLYQQIGGAENRLEDKIDTLQQQIATLSNEVSRLQGMLQVRAAPP